LLYERNMKTATIAIATFGILGIAAPVRADDLDDEGGDGPEAVAEHALKLDDLIEVLVRLNPELGKAKADRAAARGDAGAAHLDQEWKFPASATISRDGIGDTVEVVPYPVVAEDKLVANAGLGRTLPTGGNIGVEVGVQHSTQEYAIPADPTAASMMGP